MPGSMSILPQQSSMPFGQASMPQLYPMQQTLGMQPGGTPAGMQASIGMHAMGMHPGLQQQWQQQPQAAHLQQMQYMQHMAMMQQQQQQQIQQMRLLQQHMGDPRFGGQTPFQQPPGMGMSLPHAAGICACSQVS